MHSYRAESVRAQIAAIMTAFDVPAAGAEICTEVMYDTDLAGIDSHGISMLPTYHKEMLEGTTDAHGEPVIVSEGPAFALIDGKQAFGHLGAHLGMRTAIEKARTAGVGLASVGNTNHFGAAGYYARMAADEGMMGIALCSTRTALQTPTGATHPLMGTNPIAFAAPVSGEEPVVVDMATTVVPYNKVKVYQLKDADLPAPWVVNTAGEEIADSQRAFAGLGDPEAAEVTGLLPLGGSTTFTAGHKGYALATMVQILSAAISGADQPGNREGYHNVGYFFLAVNTELINPGVAADYTKVLRDTLRGMTPVDPDTPVQVAGDPEEKTRAHRREHGVPLPDALIDQLKDVCAARGADFVLEVQEENVADSYTLQAGTPQAGGSQAGSPQAGE